MEPTTTPSPAGGSPTPGGAERLSSVVALLVAIEAGTASLAAMRDRVLTSAFEVAEAQADSRRGSDTELSVRNVCAELGTALRVPDRSMQRRLSEAYDMTTRFARVHAAQIAGHLSAAHAATIVEAGRAIANDEDREAFCEMALKVAASETPARLKVAILPVSEQLRSDSIDTRHRVARALRRVEVRDLGDGMSELLAVLPSVLAHAIRDRLTQMARKVSVERSDAPSLAIEKPEPVAPDDRTFDQIRADVLCDVALGGAPVAAGGGMANIRGEVAVVVPALTLAGVTHTGAELAGVGPIDADTAREIAASATGWDRVFLHPESGAVLSVDRYRPSDAIRRAIRTRDQHCRFPGCRQRARRCDIDHTKDAAFGGATSVCNLACLCRSHHTLKHATPWRVQNDGSGILTWTSPLGSVYRDVPPRMVVFSSRSDPPPYEPADPAPF